MPSPARSDSEINPERAFLSVFRRFEKALATTAEKPASSMASNSGKGRGKIEPQRVGLVHRQTLLGKALAQARAQVPVQLDGVQVLDALKKRRGQRAQPGAYFDDVLAAPRIDRRDDALDDSPLDEKVLT